MHMDRHTNESDNSSARGCSAVDSVHVGAGGALMGHLTAYYHTAAQARQATGTVSGSVSGAGGSASATTSVSSDVAETSGHDKTETKFAAYGWNQEDKLPPKVCLD